MTEREITDPLESVIEDTARRMTSRVVPRTLQAGVRTRITVSPARRFGGQLLRPAVGAVAALVVLMLAGWLGTSVLGPPAADAPSGAAPAALGPRQLPPPLPARDASPASHPDVASSGPPRQAMRITARVEPSSNAPLVIEPIVLEPLPGVPPSDAGALMVLQIEPIRVEPISLE
jgi:hypothetical protein